MGFIAAGTSFGMKGGDSALAKRQQQFAAMQTLARRHSLLGEDEERPDPSGFKSMFFRAVDLISRPNYAVAGFFDTLAGTGVKGEYAFERAFRELFSGVAGLQGDKETFGDVLEQAGFGEGGKLSDFLGENGLTRRFNPSTRGAVGLALDVFLDPLTYISAPVKNASRVLGVGGEIRYLSDAGRKALVEGYQAEIRAARKYFGMADDASEIAVLDRLRTSPMYTAEQTDIAKAVLRAGSQNVDEAGRSTTQGIGIVAARDLVQDRAAQQLIEAGNDALFEKGGLRFRIPATGIDIPVGLDQAAVAGAKRLGSFMRSGMTKTDTGRALYEHGYQIVDDLIRLVNRHPLGTQRNKAYLHLEDRRFRMFNAASNVAGQEIDYMLRGLSKAQLEDRELWTSFIRAVEDRVGDRAEEFFSLATSKGVDDPKRLLGDWRALFDRVGSVEADAKLLDAEAFATWQGHYFSRLLVNADDAVKARLAPADSALRADLGQFKEARQFETWDDFVAAFTEAGGKESDLVVNPRVVGVARLGAHYETLVNQQFLDDVAQRFGHMTNEHVERVSRAMSASSKTMTKAEQGEIRALAELDDILVGEGGDYAASLELFRGLRKPARAGYIASLLSRIDDIESFSKMVDKYGDDIAKFDGLDEVVDAMYEGKQVVLRDVFGQRFKTGEFAGKRMSLPSSMVDDIAEFEKRFDPTPEMSRLLRNYDTLNNWWKVAVTRWFPNFWTRNAYSNLATMHTDLGIGALNPLYAKRAFDAMRGADGTIPIRGGGRITYEAFRNEMAALGIRVDRNLITEMTGRGASDPLEALIENRLRAGDGAIWKNAEKAYVGLGELENHARVMHALVLRQRGYSPQDVAYQVNKFLVDYNALSATEKGLWRRLFPFWTWTKNNAVLHVKSLYERPGRLATQAKLFMQDRGPDGDHLPEYMRGQMSAQLAKGPSGETWLTGIDLPFGSLDILWAGSLGKTFREQIGMLTPFIKTPLEVGSGQDFFSGDGTRGHGKINQRLGAAMSRNMPQKMQDWFELRNVGGDDNPRWEANRLKVHLVMKGLFLSRFVSQGVRIDELAASLGKGDEDTGLRTMIKLLVGLDLRSVTLDEKQRASLFNNARLLEDRLIERGIMRSFERRYIPKDGKTPKPASGTPVLFGSAT